jgi:hypothetical protein
MVRHNVTLIGQRANMSCWEAAAAMVMGEGAMCLDPGRAKASPWKGMVASDENVKRFAEQMGLRYHSPKMTRALGALQELIARGPVWVAGAVPTGHAYVVAGYFGNELQIYDPWPPGQGRIYWVRYGDWINKHPLGMVWMLTPR